MTASNPARRTLAGFVPWAESGIATFRRGAACPLVVRAHDQQPGELAAGAGRRLEGRPRHPGDLAQRALEAPEQLERPLGGGVGLPRVQRAEPGELRQPFSAIFGLYFIEHEPSGYKPVSTP